MSEWSSERKFTKMFKFEQRKNMVLPGFPRTLRPSGRVNKFTKMFKFGQRKNMVLPGFEPGIFAESRQRHTGLDHRTLNVKEKYTIY